MPKPPKARNNYKTSDRSISLSKRLFLTIVARKIFSNSEDTFILQDLADQRMRAHINKTITKYNDLVDLRLRYDMRPEEQDLI